MNNKNKLKIAGSNPPFNADRGGKKKQQINEL